MTPQENFQTFHLILPLTSLQSIHHRSVDSPQLLITSLLLVA